MLVTGGFKGFVHDAGSPSGDWSFVKGACASLKARGDAMENHIETLLADPEKDSSNIVRFKEGIVTHLYGRSLQSRRFKLVGSVDVMVAIEGAKGTREVIDLALALEKPILPLPFTGGVAGVRWHENKAIICEWFEIDPETALAWEALSLRDLAGEQIAALSRAVRQHLLHQLKRKCFVMMPFGPEFLPLYCQAIKPEIETCGFLPVRIDQLDLVGDVVSALYGAIRTSTCGLAVITGNNANVMYELGLSHAQGKQVILLCEFAAGDQMLPELPYDLRHESVIGYRHGDWGGFAARYPIRIESNGHRDR